MALRNRIPSRRIARAGSVLLSASAIAQLVGLAATPILSRLYDPEVFGLTATLSSWALLLSIASALRLDMAIPIAGSDSEARSLTQFALSIVTAINALFALGLGAMVYLGAAPAIALWIPAISAATGWLSIQFALSTRQKDYWAISQRTLSKAITQIVLQLVAGFGKRADGLLVGVLGGSLVAALTMVKRLGLGAGSLLGTGLVARNWPFLRQYRSHALLLMPAALANTAGLVAPVLLIRWFYGLDAAGQFSLAMSIVLAPVALFGSAAATLFLGEAASFRRDGLGGQGRGMFLKMSLGLLGVAAVIGLPLALAGPALFSVLFGSQWEQAGLFAAIMVPAMAARLVAGPTSQTMILHGKNGSQFTWDVARLAVIVAAPWVASVQGLSAAWAVALLSVASTAAYVGLWAQSYRTLRQAEGRD
jgi:O-antigen/teichoic acid export membrane protein